MTLECLYNTRDLGGLPAADGRSIRPGRLYRSGQLYAASPADCQTLEAHLSLILDLRTPEERAEKPDPVLRGVENRPLPVLDTLAMGMTHEHEADEEALRTLTLSPETAERMMCRTYERLILQEEASAHYRHFLDALLEPQERGILWHCTAGKDRAGFAAVLIEKILGVPEAVIRREYLATNTYLAPEVDALLNALVPEPGSVREAMRLMFSAKESYLDTALTLIEAKYGSFDRYLTEALGLDREERSALRAMYLTE